MTAPVVDSRAKNASVLPQRRGGAARMASDDGVANPLLRTPATPETSEDERGAAATGGGARDRGPEAREDSVDPAALAPWAPVQDGPWAAAVGRCLHPRL